MGQVKKFQYDESDLGVFRRKYQDWELTEYEYDGFKVVRADKPGARKEDQTLPARWLVRLSERRQERFASALQPKRIIS